MKNLPAIKTVKSWVWKVPEDEWLPLQIFFQIWTETLAGDSPWVTKVEYDLAKRQQFYNMGEYWILGPFDVSNWLKLLEF